MEFVVLAVVIVGAVLTIPVIAIIALARGAETRRLLDDATANSREKFLDLEREIAILRRQIVEISARPIQPVPTRAVDPATALRTPEPRAAAHTPPPAVAPFEAPKPTPQPAPPIPAQPARAIPEQSLPVTPPLAAPTNTTPPQPTVSQTSAPPVIPAARPEPVLNPPLAQAPIPPPAAPPLHSAPVAPGTTPAPAAPAPAPPPGPYYRQIQSPHFPAVEPGPPRKTFAERLRAVLPLEEVLGMNLFAKLGIVLLVLGFALLGRVALISMGPIARVALIYAVAGVMLGGGIRLEGRERYRLVGRTGIGGGWALLFFTTYAMYHVPAMTVMRSNMLDCMLMFIVAVAMVGHTLRYKSQLVTGLAFLLAFSTIALSQDTVYSLVAGVILAIGIAAIALRMGWFELEVFGILASYANHFYWLYRLFPYGVAGHSFPQFWPSVIILILYWLIFRISYIERTIRVPRDETISTIAALLNTMLLLVVLKYQATHPEWAFYALLGLGALEFLFGQLPITRRRRAAFVLLTVIGTLLIFAAVPFRFSGNNIALFWMIAAEVLLTAGIVQLEVLFRRLGLLAGFITGLLIIGEAQHLVKFRETSEAFLLKDGALLLTASVLFYINALFINRKWRDLFGDFDTALVIGQSYIGCITAFLGVWGLCTGDWTAIGWAILMLSAAFGVRYLDNKHLLFHAMALFVAVVVRAAFFNCDVVNAYPHRIPLRLATLPILAALFYVTAWALSCVGDLRFAVRSLALWAGTALLVALAWLELPPMFIAPVWMALAVVLVLVGRRLKLSEFAYQEHLLAVLVAMQLFAVNTSSQSAVERYWPFIGCAAAMYAISRLCTLKDALYRRPAAWVHTWAATALLATLAWNESPQPWLTAIWALFAVSLALVDRFFEVEELPWQAHVLALLAVIRAVTLNLYSLDKWHGIDLRLITVAILVAVLYAMAIWIRMPQSQRGSEARHAYTWAASGLTAWLLWSELQPIAVAPGLAIFGLALFEIGSWRQLRQIRIQGYIALAASFARIFFVNLTAATLPGELLGPRIYTVAPLALIYFFVWARLQSGKRKSELERWSPSDLIAYFGTGSIAAILYFQTPAEWIVVSFAALALVLLAVTLLLDQEVFHQQAALLVGGTLARGFAHNIFAGSYFGEGGWRGSFFVLSLASALLFAALPVAFKLRKRYADRTNITFLSLYTGLQYPEQVLFFAPILLISCVIAVKMNPGMVTLSWGVEGVAVIVLGLIVSQRSYRITGLILLLVCVAKIIFHDAWQLNERDRYITFIALGAALTLVSTLYGRFREVVRRLP